MESVEPKKKRGRPRKVVPTPTPIKTEVDVQENTNGSVEQSSESINGRARRQSSRARRSTLVVTEAEEEISSLSPKNSEPSKGIDNELEDSQVSCAETDQEIHDLDMAFDEQFKQFTSKKRGRRKGSRGRGRGRSSQRYWDIMDVTYSPSNKVTKIPTESNNQENAKEKEQNLEDSVTQLVTVKCGKCKEEMSKATWYSHNPHKHNYLGWREGLDSVVDETDITLMNSLLKKALKKTKVLVCQMPDCPVRKKSVEGFKSHMQFCGKNTLQKLELLETCEKCGKTMRPSSMLVHKSTHRVEEKHLKRMESEDVLEESVEDSSRSQRKAAQRASTRISDFSNESQKIEKLTKFALQRPRSAKTITHLQLKKWQNDVKKTGFVECKQPDCSFRSVSAESLMQHSKTCNFTPATNYSCKLCSRSGVAFERPTEAEMMLHIQDKHTMDELDDQDPRNKNFSKEETDDDEDEDDDEDDYDSEEEAKGEAYKLMDAGERKKHRNLEESLMSEGYTSRSSHKKCQFIHELLTGRHELYRGRILDWTLDFELRNYSLELFVDLSPKDFAMLSPGDVTDYLPQETISMKTAIVPAAAADVKEDEWKRWKRFDGGIQSVTPQMFCGGPIWALAWLPVPTAIHPKQVDQFLAVSTHPSMDFDPPVDEPYGKNVIQIWNMGILDDNPNAKDIVSPKLAYMISHEAGTSWCMEWCPSGCYEDSQLHPDKDQDETEKTERKYGKKRRMGLLAVGFIDGTIRIFSLPFPEDICLDSCSVPVLKNDPVLTLVWSHEAQDQKWQVTQLNWGKEKGHNVIAAGYSSGYVALWNVGKRSPILLKNNVLEPYHKFHAHRHAVTMMAIVPYAGQRFLVTASLDRYLKLWDLEKKPCQPVWFRKKGIITNGSWLTFWPTAAVIFDDCLNWNQFGSYLFGMREIEFDHLLAIKSGCTMFSTSTCDSISGIVQGTLAGSVYAMVAPAPLYARDLEVSFPRSRLLCSTINVVDFQKEPEIQSENSKSEKKGTKSKKKKKDVDYKYLPQTYEECKDRFGLAFWDEVNFTYQRVQSKDRNVKTDKQVNVEVYDFTSVNRVAWNPNVASHLWIAAGYENGLVRLMNLKLMAIPEQQVRALDQHLLDIFNREHSSDQN